MSFGETQSKIQKTQSLAVIPIYSSNNNINIEPTLNSLNSIN